MVLILTRIANAATLASVSRNQILRYNPRHYLKHTRKMDDPVNI